MLSFLSARSLSVDFDFDFHLFNIDDWLISSSMIGYDGSFAHSDIVALDASMLSRSILGFIRVSADPTRRSVDRF